nr:hypothetical protein [Tanacetum cinerariifolium]
MTPSTIATIITTRSQAPIPPTPIPNEVLQNLPTFASVFRFEDRLKSLDANFSEFIQTNLFAKAVSAIPGNVDQYMNQQMNEAVKGQVKEQVSSSKTSYAVAADLSEMELKKILIEKMEGNKSIQCSDEQRNLYKALVEAYEANKIILDTYGETFARPCGFVRVVLYKQPSDLRVVMNEAVRVAVQIQTDRIRDSYQRENDEFLRTIDENMKRIIKESSHSAKTSYAVAADLSEMELKKILIEKMEGNKSIQCSDKQRNLYKALVEAYEADKIILDTYGETGSKRRKEGKEPESASAPLETITRSTGRSTIGSKLSKFRQASHPEWFSQSQKPLTLDRDWNKTLPAVQGSTQTWISELAKQADTRSSFNELLDTPLDFFNFIMNRLRVDTLTLELLVGPTYELMKGSCTSLIELEYHLEEVYKATTDQLDWVNPEDLKIVEWHSYKHLNWISIRCDNDKIYKFKEGDFKRLRLQDIKDMRLLLVQGKLSNLTVEEHFAFNVSLRMLTISIVIQRRMEDLQLGVESYQKRLNLTMPDTYRKNRLMRIDELHKFSDGTLNDVRTALDDRLKGIRMQYLPQTIWRKGDKDRAATMIQAIDKIIKTRRIMRSLEKFIG